MSNIECNLHKNSSTIPGVSPSSKGFFANIFKSEDERLIAKYLLDSDNNFRLRHPFVVEALFELIRPTLLKRLKEYEANCKESENCPCNSKD